MCRWENGVLIGVAVLSLMLEQALADSLSPIINSLAGSCLLQIRPFRLTCYLSPNTCAATSTSQRKVRNESSSRAIQHSEQSLLSRGGGLAGHRDGIHILDVHSPPATSAGLGEVVVGEGATHSDALA